MRLADFDHNAHYHGMLLRHVPPHVHRALDVGCGRGEFARRLAGRGASVDAIDSDPAVVEAARAAHDGSHVTYLTGDVLTHDLGRGRYDVVSCLASLHHLPLVPAVTRLRGALAPGGTLLVLGCYREETATDRLISHSAVPVNAAIRAVLAQSRRPHGIVDSPAAPVRTAEPEHTRGEIAHAVRGLLPGARVRRHLFWRYSLVYRAPR